MPDYRYLIVGGGMTADAAVRGIRDRDPEGSIGLVGAEPDPPYNRPPLSKGLWQERDESVIWRHTDELGVELHLGRRIASIDPQGQTATDERGERFGFERLLLATGGRPRRLPGADAGVIYFRTLADYRRLRALAEPGARVVVIGGGFIGSELAAALVGAGCEVTMVFPEAGIGARLFPADLAAAVDDLYRGHGVVVEPGALVESVAAEGDGVAVALADGRRLAADAVVAGLGIEPRAELAAEAGVRVADGILVDLYGATEPGGAVFAAGDAARFPAPLLGTHVRVEHEDNANSHGFAVGANMAGAGEPYRHLPFFYSDLFDAGYEAVGEVDSRHRTVAEWAEPFGRGVVAYLDESERPRGFLLWNLFGRLDPARELIGAGAPVGGDDLRGLLG